VDQIIERALANDRVKPSQQDVVHDATEEVSGWLRPLWMAIYQASSHV
jgi:hypothetical protein